MTFKWNLSIILFNQQRFQFNVRRNTLEMASLFFNWAKWKLMEKIGFNMSAEEKKEANNDIAKKPNSISNFRQLFLQPQQKVLPIKRLSDVEKREFCKCVAKRLHGPTFCSRCDQVGPYFWAVRLKICHTHVYCFVLLSCVSWCITLLRMTTTKTNTNKAHTKNNVNFQHSNKREKANIPTHLRSFRQIINSCHWKPFGVSAPIRNRKHV